MSLFRRDVILKAVEQCNETLNLVARLREVDENANALQIVQDHLERVVGPLRGMIEKVDAPSVAMLMGDAKRVRAYGLLMAEQSVLLESVGRGADGLRTGRRAAAILLAWREKASEPDDEEVLRALVKLGVESLG